MSLWVGFYYFLFVLCRGTAGELIDVGLPLHSSGLYAIFVIFTHCSLTFDTCHGTRSVIDAQKLTESVASTPGLVTCIDCKCWDICQAVKKEGNIGGY